MGEFKLSGYINDLHQQIYNSVDKIKRRNISAKEEFNQESQTNSSLNRYSVEEYGYRLLSKDVSWSLQNMPYDTENKIMYGVSRYCYADNIIEQPKVLLDLMYKNNREFDFKV